MGIKLANERRERFVEELKMDEENVNNEKNKTAPHYTLYIWIKCAFVHL